MIRARNENRPLDLWASGNGAQPRFQVRPNPDRPCGRAAGGPASPDGISCEDVRDALGIVVAPCVFEYAGSTSSPARADVPSPPNRSDPREVASVSTIAGIPQL